MEEKNEKNRRKTIKLEGRRKRGEKFRTRYKKTLYGVELKEQGRLVCGV